MPILLDLSVRAALFKSTTEISPHLRAAGIQKFKMRHYPKVRTVAVDFGLLIASRRGIQVPRRRTTFGSIRQRMTRIALSSA